MTNERWYDVANVSEFFSPSKQLIMDWIAASIIYLNENPDFRGADDHII